MQMATLLTFSPCSWAFRLRLPGLLCCSLLSLPALAADGAPNQELPAVMPAEIIADPVPELPVANTDHGGEDLPLPVDEVRIFAQVLHQIRTAYIEPIDDQQLLENAIRGMLAGIDPHSTYLADDDYEQLQESTTGEFGGLGVEVSIEDGLIKIIAPLDGSPAARAGIQAGDLIIKLDDTPTRNVTLDDTSELLRGEPGTSIRLTIVREGVDQPFEVTVTREIIQARSLRSRELDPGYTYLRISQFAANTGQEVVAELEKLYQAETPPKGLILDLRNNPGGVLRAAVDVVDAFLSEGLIVYTQGRVANADMRFEATSPDPSQGLPLVVLINGGSASASEIVAGALQDHHRAIVMGTQSFGKGSVQTVLPVTADRAIKLTTSLYYTPSGHSIQARGITPDVNVDRGQVTRIPDSITAYREANLDGHLNAPEEEQPVAARNTPTEPPEILVNDYQLQEALNVLKGLNVLRR